MAEVTVSSSCGKRVSTYTHILFRPLSALVACGSCPSPCCRCKISRIIPKYDVTRHKMNGNNNGTWYMFVRTAILIKTIFLRLFRVRSLYVTLRLLLFFIPENLSLLFFFFFAVVLIARKIKLFSSHLAAARAKAVKGTTTTRRGPTLCYGGP